jgi:hypothetical protein
MPDKAVVALEEYREAKLLSAMYNIAYGRKLKPLEFLELGNAQDKKCSDKCKKTR